jgi:hypothetical protein
MRIFIIVILLIGLLPFGLISVDRSPATGIDRISFRTPENNDFTGVSEGWELMPLPDEFKPSTVAFGEKGEIVLIGNDIRYSKDNGETWKIITGGKGFTRCTKDGGKTFDKDCDTNGKKPGKIRFDDHVDSLGVSGSALTSDGRLYLFAAYDHSNVLWSIPLENPKQFWQGLYFREENIVPNDLTYTATGTFITLKDRIFVSAESSDDDNYNWLTTDNKGKTWHRARFNLASDRYFADGENGLRFVGKRLEKTVDGGRSWQILQSPKTPDAAYSNTFLDDKTGFACGKAGLFATTKDGGRTWRTIDLGIKKDLYAAAALDEKNVWAAGDKGFVFETADGGETWQTVDLEFKGGFYATFLEDDIKIDKLRRTVWIIKGGKIYRKKIN